MRSLSWSVVAVAVVAWPLAGTRADAAPTPWALFRTPTSHPARAIGGYSAGCIDGAVALPKVGDGFRVAKPERNRVFGHPLLVGMIRDLGKRLIALHLPPLAVGDLGQPRGGPAPTGHASHQTGLDVDLWFLPPVAGQAQSMVDRARMQPSPKFTDAVVRMLALAASDSRVERIFVNPVLKRALCERTAGDAERGWLAKLRPWWGHDDHFHVRLACPADSPECTPQPALPPGDGCGELAWWFDEKAQADREKGHQSYTAKVGAAPVLPPGCNALLDEK
ncbi:MAG TPA: penicillin-insensitive murein endopeptidase [Polyangia bacterium]|nr:penicillin-insensitive murein endopeptidase [Polyangia bacterium]